MAYEVTPKEHWPEMSALICVVSDEKKGTSSTAGMQQTVETSHLLQQRIKDVVPQRMKEMEAAIKSKDFAKFAELTIRDSNQFHAVCMDTYPPIFYMNDVSKAIIAVVNEINKTKDSPIAAYTYDAGPNAVIYALEKDMAYIKQIIQAYFVAGEAEKLPEAFASSKLSKAYKGGVSRLIHTRVGDGPRVLDASESLIGKDGLPAKS